MNRILAVALGVFAVVLFLGGALPTVEAGAKDGKIRWSHKKTGGCAWHEAIKVPEAKDDKTPGVWSTKIEFKGKELAEFFVIGDGDTDLDLVVKDSKGKIVAKDVDPAEAGSDLCVCRWTPEKTEVYTIYIINRGKIYNMATAGCN